MKEVYDKNRIAELAEQLRESNKELKKLDAAKSEFVSIASHQLRAPLTVIKGYISMFLDGTFGAIASNGKEALSKVAFSTEQLVKLVGDLLNLSRIESGKLRYTLTRTDILSLIKEVLEEFRISFEEKKIKLNLVNSLSKPIYLYADSDKIREVALNLISNALKYAKEKVDIEVESLGHGKHDSMVRIVVKDDGIGIKSEDLASIFTKFHRTPEAQKIDPNGMGIGLYFVKRIVEDHGGTIRVESEGLGTGSTFSVELPIQQ
jgi:signal transduction histidine kinase